MRSPSPKSRDANRKKTDKRERTRSALLEAARELIREHGYERTTLRDVARKAGMTTGAIYGNFKSRDDLFIALAEDYWGPLAVDFPPGSSFAQKMSLWAQAAIEAVPTRSEAAVGALTGRAYALQSNVLRKRVQRITAKAYEDGAQWLRAATHERELSLPPELMVRVLHVLTDGLLFQRILTPQLISDEVFHAAFSILAKSCSEGSEPIPSSPSSLARQTTRGAKRKRDGSRR